MTDSADGLDTPIAPTVVTVDMAPAWPPNRHPFQVSSMGAFFTIGAGYFINKPSPVLEALMPHWFLVVWSIILMISGACGLISAVMSRRDEGLSLLTERIALIGIGGYALVTTIAMIGSLHWTPWVSETLFCLFLTASIWRYVQVQIRINYNKKVGRTNRPRWVR